jgi:hypothetical protein
VELGAQGKQPRINTNELKPPQNSMQSFTRTQHFVHADAHAQTSKQLISQSLDTATETGFFSTQPCSAPSLLGSFHTPDKAQTREATTQPQSKSYLQTIAASKSGCWVVSSLNELDMKAVRVTFRLVAPVTHGLQKSHKHN